MDDPREPIQSVFVLPITLKSIRKSATFFLGGGPIIYSQINMKIGNITKIGNIFSRRETHNLLSNQYENRQHSVFHIESNEQNKY